MSGSFFLLLAGSLWHKGAYNRTFPCIEENYPYAVKNQPGARGLVLYGIRLLAQATLWSSRPMRVEPRNSSTNESGPDCQSGQARPSGRVEQVWLTDKVTPDRTDESYNYSVLAFLNTECNEHKTQLIKWEIINLLILISSITLYSVSLVSGVQFRCARPIFASTDVFSLA